MTAQQVFVNALRECLGLGPLYDAVRIERRRHADAMPQALADFDGAMPRTHAVGWSEREQWTDDAH